jgi:HlyD family secretion protein
MTKRKKIILMAVVGLVLIFSISKILFKKPSVSFVPEKVGRGTVVQEVTESGIVQMDESLNLNFKNSGKIENIYVKVGDDVSAGEKLAQLDTDQLSLQLAEAEANVAALSARLSELQKGANSDLYSYYSLTPTVLNQAYNLADNAIRQQIASLFIYRAEASTPYFELTYNNCDSLAASDSASQRKLAEDSLNSWSSELKNLGTAYSQLDGAIKKANDYLKTFQIFFGSLSATLNSDCKLTSEELTKINSYKTIVNAAITSLNTAASSVSTQDKTISAQKLLVANYGTDDARKQITYQEALVLQAESGVALLRKQIQDSVLRSPIDGQIADINKSEGELVQPAESFVVLLPKSSFQIKADIYEEDIVKVQVDNPVDISLTAFPDQVFQGKVISIDPASKLVDGVVYYGITIGFPKPPKEIRPGMSADIVIKAATKENVLVVSGSAIEKKDGKFFVIMVKNGATTTEKEIQTGLTGSDNKVEVVSGLQEGEEIAVPK